MIEHEGNSFFFHLFERRSFIYIYIYIHNMIRVCIVYRTHADDYSSIYTQTMFVMNNRTVTASI